MTTKSITPRTARISALDLMKARGAVRVELAQALYQDDPVAWARDRLRVDLWSKQREILAALQQHRRVAVHSSFDVGKSFIASVAATWWIDSHPAGEAFVVTSAPTAPQVRAILWREMNRHHRSAGLDGRMNQTEWWLNDELVAMGRKPSDYNSASFQGIHQRYPLVVLDEAAGLSAAIWTGAEGLITNEYARILAIGNPDDPGSRFAQICRPGSGWHVIHISAFDTPAFTGEDVPDDLLPLLVSKAWVDEKREDWGEDSPLYVSRVLGLFPEETENGVIPLGFIRRCQLEPTHERSALFPIELGVDVGAGGDSTVIRERRGVRVGREWRSKSKDPMEVVGLIVNAIRESRAVRVKVDVIGIGWGVAGRLVELHNQGTISAEVIGVNVSRASTQPKRFPNVRSQIWWEIGRELSRQQAWDLTLDKDSGEGLTDDVIAELIAPRYSLDSSGRIVVERKDETKARLGHSPDGADALLLAFYTPPGFGYYSMDEEAPEVDDRRTEARRLEDIVGVATIPEDT